MKLQIVSVMFLAFLMGLGIANAAPAPGTCVDASAATGGRLLSNLINNSSCIISGDKEFFGFNFSQTATGVHANDINVTTIGDGTANNLYGIEFGGNIALNNIGGSSAASGDVRLFYDVTTTGSLLISDIHQFINASDNSSTNNANDFVTVTETATDDSNGGNTAMSTLHITDNGSTNDLNDPPAEVNDVLLFGTPVKQADITKDIQLGAAAGVNTSVSIIQQRFSQVPEPRDLAILLSLGLGIMLWRKRSSARA